MKNKPAYANLWQRFLSGTVDLVVIAFFVKLISWLMLPQLEVFAIEVVHPFIFSLEWTDNYLRVFERFYACSFAFILGSAYFLFTCLSKYRATLGMRLLKLKIYQTNFNKVHWAALILRTFLMTYGRSVIIILFLSYLKTDSISEMGFGIIDGMSVMIDLFIVALMILFTRKKQTYYDLATRTVIVKEENAPKM